MDILTSHSPAWLAGLVLALVVTGAIAGVLAGLLGVGGGIVIVPVLYHLFTLLGIDESVRMHVTVGTSLATIIPTSIMSSRAHRRRGSLDVSLIRRLMPGVVVGVVLGAIASRYLGGGVLTAVFAVVALAVALNMAFKRDGFALADGLPGPAGTALIGGGIGGVSTLMGIGGGTLSVPFMAWCNVAMHTAIGTSAAIGFPIAVSGTVGYIVNGLATQGLPANTFGFVYLPALIGIVCASVLTAPLGVRLAHSLPVAKLKRIFAVLLLVIATRMLISLL